MATRCRQFAREMVDLCRTSHEVSVLLNRKEGVEKTNLKDDRAIFPRLLVALHYGQKEVTTPLEISHIDETWKIHNTALDIHLCLEKVSFIIFETVVNTTNCVYIIYFMIFSL